MVNVFFITVGGDWNYGILNDFPETVGNVIIPTDMKSMIFQRGRSTTNQICPLFWDAEIAFFERAYMGDPMWFSSQFRLSKVAKCVSCILLHL